MTPSATDILWLVGYPALLAAVAMLATRPWRRGRDLGGWGAAVAVSGGFAIAFVRVFGGVPPFPPASAQQWLFFLAVPVVLVALTQAWVRAGWFGIVAPALVAGITPYLVLRKVAFVEAPTLWAWIAGGAVVAIAWWGGMELLAQRARGGSLPLLMALVFAAAGLVVINAHSATLGQMAGALAVPLVVVAAAALLNGGGGTSLARGGALAIAVFLLGLLLTAHFFADLRLRDFILLVAAPLAAWVGDVPKLGRPDSWKRLALRTAAVLAVLALPAYDAATGLKATADEQFDAYSY